MKYDVDLQRLHHKRGELTQASCVSAKSDGGREKNTENRHKDFCGFWFTVILVGDPLTKNKDMIAD